MSAGRRIVTAVALAVLAVGLHGGGSGRRCGPDAAAAETIPPLTIRELSRTAALRFRELAFSGLVHAAADIAPY